MKKQFFTMKMRYYMFHFIAKFGFNKIEEEIKINNNNCLLYNTLSYYFQ